MTTVQATRRELAARHRARDLVRFDVGNNHVPMVLAALERLGATADELRAYVAQIPYDPAPTPSPRASISRETWREHLGRHERAAALIAHFVDDVGARGRRAVLDEVIDELMAGVGAHAFHPLLRLGHALDADDDEEVGAALGYWVAAYLPGPPLDRDAEPVPFGALLEGLLASRELAALEPCGGNIGQRMECFFDDPAFAPLAPRVAYDADDPLAEIARCSADAFVDRHHFTLLHAITSTRALGVVLPYVGDVEAAVTHHAHALGAAVLTVAVAPPAGHTPLPDDDEPWPAIIRAAIATHDDHVIKLVDACREEKRRTGDERYRRIALRDVRHPSPFS